MENYPAERPRSRRPARAENRTAFARRLASDIRAGIVARYAHNWSAAVKGQPLCVGGERDPSRAVVAIVSWRMKIIACNPTMSHLITEPSYY